MREGALRELWEEAGIDGSRLHLEQLGAYGDPGRDPRGRVVTIAYLALGPDLPAPVGGTDAKRAYGAPVSQPTNGAQELAFDHLVAVTAPEQGAIREGAPGLHCITLNRAAAALDIHRNIQTTRCRRVG
ncbi:NUDIX domain-containing protein [Streptomyces acidicola]|uniref:NUDIX domain-containing protein n=1 Tax=Streptomyces acidicola TaxID=2596892 RepID=UPI003F4D7DB0